MNFIAFLLILILPFTLFAQAEELNLEKLVKVLETKKPNTVARALDELKAQYPSFFENYALVARSMSIQGSNSQNPRVLLFNEGAKLVLSFNGDPNERGYDRLELMNFDAEKKSYDFREIKFFGDSSTEGTFEISESGGVDGRCLRCHGQNATPIWDSFPLWPDAYGAFAQTRERSSLATVQKGELASYMSYLENAKSHDRYKVLPELDFELLSVMNTALGRAFSVRVRETAKAELAALPELAEKLKSVFASFEPSEFVIPNATIALPLRPLEPAQLELLKKVSDYHSTKLTRYGRNFGIDRVELLNQLVDLQADTITKISNSTGILATDKLQLWTYTQTSVADLYLIPKLNSLLGQDLMYLNAWSIIPGRRFIEFSQEDLLPNESGIEHALADLL